MYLHLICNTQIFAQLQCDNALLRYSVSQAGCLEQALIPILLSAQMEIKYPHITFCSCGDSCIWGEWRKLPPVAKTV